MQSMQRQFGKLLNKGPGDNAKVSIILNEYEDADKVLAKIADSTKSCRDAWHGILSSQLGIVTEYEGLYDPIVGATDGHGVEPILTSQPLLDRTFRLKEAYTELRSELSEEISQLDVRIIRPATDARVYIDPIRKTIKKRENKRLDYEKAQDKANKLHKKMNRTPKEDGQLAKAEEEMARLGEEFQIADAHLRETLPPIITAAFSLIPPLMEAMIMVQNRILALYYTVLHQYCEDNDFPSPPPPMEEVIARWAADFRPAQRDVESVPCIARGKAVHQPMSLGSDDGVGPGLRKTSTSGSTGRSSMEPPRRKSSGLIPNGGSGAVVRRVPSMNSLAPPTPHDAPPSPQNPSPRGSQTGFRTPSHANQSASNLLMPTSFTQATVLGGGPVVHPSLQSPGSGAHSPGGSSLHRSPSSDYFPRGGEGNGHPLSRPLTASSTASYSNNNGNGNNGNHYYNGGVSPSASSSALALQKKKPPPPPPPKRIPSAPRPPDEYVVAQYPFAGQGAGDLSFSAGDRIRVVKRTATDQDWWEGELVGAPGRRGQFPANYTKVV